jgi:glycosyltransferase involved in cell wall biosynthesis
VVVDEVNGYLCEVKNAQSLAQAMEKVARLTPTQRRVLGHAGRERVEQQFAEDYVVSFYIQAILDMVQ